MKESAGGGLFLRRICYSHPVLKAFERTKQKMYKRYERTTWSLEALPKGISFEEYLNWREGASQARDKYIKGELTKEEALKIIEDKD